MSGYMAGGGGPPSQSGASGFGGGMIAGGSVYGPGFQGGAGGVGGGVISGGYGSGGNPMSDAAARDYAMDMAPPTKQQNRRSAGVAFQTDLSRVGGSSKAGAGGGLRIFGAGGVQNQVVEERRLIDKVFAICDKDNSGTIDMKELEDLLKLCGVNSEFIMTAISRIMTNVDKDFDGQISPQEFHAILSQRFEEGDSRDDILKVFKQMDKNGDRHLDPRELMETAAYMGEELTEEECEDMIKVFSIDYQKSMQEFQTKPRGERGDKKEEPRPPKRMTEEDFIKVMHSRLGELGQQQGAGEEQ